ncbi:MAG: hypothetical protein KGJ86_22675, partial [Chloroflexota bacterium]|nr:hypothetical protein [Chloroflexota bacterium]
MLNHPAAVPLAFLIGLTLFLAGQFMPGAEAAAACSFLGGALLIVVAIRALARMAGLHQQTPAHLEPGEQLLVESQEVSVETRALLLRGRRDHYRARLTNRRVLLSLKVWWVNTSRDVTIGSFAAGLPTSLRNVQVLPDGAANPLPVGEAFSAGHRSPGRVVLTPAHRRGAHWTLYVP